MKNVLLLAAAFLLGWAIEAGADSGAFAGVLIQSGGSPKGFATTLNFSTNTSVSLSGGIATVTATAASSGGTNTQTGNYTLQASDSGKLVIMNCSGACTVTLYGTPSNSFYSAIESIGSTTATVALNSLNFNGSSSVPVLIKYQVMQFYSDGSNYFGLAPPVASTNITLTPASNGLSYSASGGGSGTFSALPPYYSDGTHKYVAATAYQATLPASSPTWINSVTPTVTAATNGDLVASGNGSYWATTSGTTSIEIEFSCQAGGYQVACGPWLRDSTNNVIYVLNAQSGDASTCGGTTPCAVITVNTYSYNGTGNPSFASNIYKEGAYDNGVWHFKISAAAGTATFAVSLNGGITFTTLTTHSIGTVSAGGYALFGTGSLPVIMDVYSLVVN